MRIARGLWATAVTLFVLAACARPAPGAGPSPDPSGSASAPGGNALMLRIEQYGGFAGPELTLGRLPDISVYADGRVISPGPQIMIYPPPALPNLQVGRIDPAKLTALVHRGGDLVRGGGDLGAPSIADAPTTRITVLDHGTTRYLDVVALSLASPDDPRLTPAQRNARAKLAAFAKDVGELSGAGGAETQDYRPTAVAALARPYVRGNDGLPSAPAAMPWPGPALPGEALGARTGCVTVTDAAATEVLAAAATANAMTPWTSGGKQWTVVFRPLLPDETSCADILRTR